MHRERERLIIITMFNSIKNSHKSEPIEILLFNFIPIVKSVVLQFR